MAQAPAVSNDGNGALFPMMMVRSDTLLEMSRIQPHEELMDANLLTEFREDLGKGGRDGGGASVEET